MEYTIEKRYKISILLIAIMLHLLLLGPLLITQWSHDYSTPFPHAYEMMPNDAPVIFQEPIHHLPLPENEEWGNLHAHASSLGSPDTPDEVNEQNATDITTENGKEITTQDTKTQMNDELQSPNIHKAATTLATIDSSKSESIPSNTSSTKTLAKTVAARNLANFTQGYLEQLHTEGENLINMVGGNPNKRPTAEQLKHERYWAKIQWCIQNSFVINRDRYVPNKPIHTTLQIFFTVDRQGKMSELRITHPSGYREIDEFMMYAFKYASSSFPPLPAYIIQEPYPILYTIEVMPSNEVPWHAWRN